MVLLAGWVGGGISQRPAKAQFYSFLKFLIFSDCLFSFVVSSYNYKGPIILHLCMHLDLSLQQLLQRKEATIKGDNASACSCYHVRGIMINLPLALPLLLLSRSP